MLKSRGLKVARWILFIFISSCILLLVGCYYIFNVKKTVIKEEVRDNETIIVYQIGTAFFFGPEEIKTCYYTEGYKRDCKSDNIMNDGSSLDYMQLSIVWKANTVDVKFRGMEDENSTTHSFERNK